MNYIYKLAKMFEEITRHTARITKEEASEINNKLMFSNGDLSSLVSALTNSGFDIGPKVDNDTFLIKNSDGEFIINAFIEKKYDLYNDSFEYKIRPKDMRALIKDFEIKKLKQEEKEVPEFITGAEAYKRWDDGLD